MYRTTDFLDEWKEGVDAFLRNPLGKDLVRQQYSGYEKVFRALLEAYAPYESVVTLDHAVCGQWRKEKIKEAKEELQYLLYLKGEDRNPDSEFYAILALAKGNIRTVLGFVAADKKERRASLDPESQERPTYPELYNLEAVKALLEPGKAIPSDVSALLIRDSGAVRHSGIRGLTEVASDGSATKAG